jgi:prephenate dehydrogenase
MDVGSTKRDVVDAARRALKDRIGAFVPAHPIAGKELSGVQHADAQLYREQQVILTPCPRPGRSWSRRPGPLGRPGCAGARDDAGGARRRLRGRQPLPHLLAFAYFTGILQQEQAEEFLRWPARAFATSPASRPAIRRCGATC